jgi:hypothetical protein
MIDSVILAYQAQRDLLVKILSLALQLLVRFGKERRSRSGRRWIERATGEDGVEGSQERLALLA